MAMSTMKDEQRLDLLKEIGGSKVYEERRKESLKIMYDADSRKRQVAELVRPPLHIVKGYHEQVLMPLPHPCPEAIVAYLDVAESMSTREVKPFPGSLNSYYLVCSGDRQVYANTCLLLEACARSQGDVCITKCAIDVFRSQTWRPS